MQTRKHIYHCGGEEFHGFLAFDDTQKGSRPAVLVAHDWSGQNDFAQEKAILLAKMGYLGFAVDMYGLGKNGHTLEEKEALIQPLMKDRLLLRDRMKAALSAAVDLPEVDKTKIGAIGFCFGGLCVLDLARSGADIQGVVSFHGLLQKPDYENAIRAKVLALHGFEDPMVSPADVLAF